jgi:hypothetical protein
MRECLPLPVMTGTDDLTPERWRRKDVTQVTKERNVGQKSPGSMRTVDERIAAVWREAALRRT